ncbi:hypothetical protein C8R45DRAFT_1219844 [Mycena sanguinolenta]|nr:hypothetical protein C8R45DRAFT_1219844 [Mycena sanguinolenta]
MDSGESIVIHDQRVIGYFTVAGLVVLVYDHLLTFDEEIAEVWQPLQHRTRRLASAAWFLFIRYFALSSSTLQLLTTFTDLSSKYLLSSIEGRDVTCRRPEHTQVHVLHRLLRVAAALDAELGCEILVIVLTIYRAIQQNGFTFDSPSHLWRVMIRDGLVYFFTVSLANVVNILIFYFGDTDTSNSFAWPATMIAVAMITRLMLNLRATLRVPDMDEGRATRAESLRFQLPPEESGEGSVS